MSLYEKIIKLYPTLTMADFAFGTGTIVLQNDGEGDYIKSWNHPTLAQPTEQQLASVQ